MRAASDGRKRLGSADRGAARGPGASLVRGVRKAAGPFGPRTTLPAEGAFPFERPDPQHATHHLITLTMTDSPNLERLTDA